MATRKYDNNSISMLKGADRVRKRPGVIFGSDDIEGCAHGFFEILSNSTDEAKTGHGNRIEVTKFRDGSLQVKDYGRGVPMDWNENEKRYNWELCYSELYAGGKYSDDNYDYSLGLNGLGAAATQYASRWFNVTSVRDGYEYTMKFERGNPVSKLGKKKVRGRKTGTVQTWMPDDEVFTETDIPVETIKEMLKQQAVVNAGITYTLLDEASGESFEYVYSHGIKGYVEELAGEDPITTAFLFSGEGTGRDRKDRDEYSVKASVAFCFSNKVQALSYFHNSSHLEHGGSPDKAARQAMVAAFDKEIRARGRYTAKEAKVTFGDIQDSLILVINSFSTQTSYENQTKKAINNKYIQEFLTDLIKRNMQVWFIEHKPEADKVIDQVLINKRSREQSETQRITVKKKLMEKTDVTNKVKKFVDCRSKDPEEREIFICEGDSALASLLVARDPQFQALMPIRGKILNTEKASLQSVFASDIIMDLIRVIGCGVEVRGKKLPKDIPQFDESRLKFNKVIVTCFSGDTKIKSLDGNSYSFKNLVDNGVKSLWVYALDKNGSMVPALANNIRVTGKSKCFIEITLDNGESIKCTPEHLFMNIYGEYIRADQLTPGVSLMPLHTRADWRGYEEYYDKVSCEWKHTHRTVAEKENYAEMQNAQERLNNEEYAPYNNAICVHHKDFNKRNNDPDNLGWKTSMEHISQHGQLGWLLYNVGEKHRNRVKQLWAEGKYEDIKFGGAKNTYNGSDKQKENLKKWHGDGIYQDVYFGGEKNNYNGSDKHKEVVRNVNKSEAHINSVSRGKILKTIKFLIVSNLPFDEYYYNFYRQLGTCSYDNILQHFSSYKEAYELANEKDIDLSNYTPAYMYSEYDNEKKQRQQIGNVIHALIKEGKEFNETNYNQKKGSRTVAYNNICKWFKSLDDAYEYALHNNHTVVSVKSTSCEPEDVYCCTVENYHNFLLDAGVFAHQCDADVDGQHIICLVTTMIYRLCPQIIEKGYLYYAMTPLFEIKDGSKKVPELLYAFSDEERDLIVKDIDPKKVTIQRAKGLGELDAPVMARFIDPKTRKLIRITSDSAEVMSHWFDLFMGSDVAPRKDYIEQHFDDYEMEDLDIS